MKFFKASPVPVEFLFQKLKIEKDICEAEKNLKNLKQDLENLQLLKQKYYKS